MSNKIPSYEDFLIEVERKNIVMFSHPTIPNLVGFNYLDSVTYDKKWNNVNIWARGIVFHNKKCIAIPFTKFFNIEEIDSSFMERSVSFAQEKEDGSLIISFVIDGDVHFSTRGSFESSQAKMAKEIWNDRHDLFADKNFVKNNTMLFELVGPSNRIVCRKHKEDNLILLSSINIGSGLELSQLESDLLADSIGCKRPNTYLAKTPKDIYAIIKENNDPNFEGIVVTLDLSLIHI